MLNIDKLIASAEECIGWPYVSPGNNDPSGIDCSGLLVKCFKDQGASIYHGSNTIYRKYCDDKGKLTDESQLLPGMVVFKWNPNTPEKFNDGKGDFQHIGLVTSVNPLRIVHASTETMNVKADSKIGKWKYWGKLKNVDYRGYQGNQGNQGSQGNQGNQGERTGQQVKEGEKRKAMEKITIGGGNLDAPINMREAGSTASTLVAQIPQGGEAMLISWGKSWSEINYNGHSGFVKTEFIRQNGSGSDGSGTVTLTMTTDEAQVILPMLEKIVEQIVDQIGRG